MAQVLIDYCPQPHQLQLHNCHTSLVCVTGRQIGKALFIDTPILTTNGYKKLIDVKEGDIIFSENGKQTKVLHKSDVYYDRECFEVEFSNGEKIIADASHDWIVEDYKYRKSISRYPNKERKPLKLTTKEIFKSFMVKRKDLRFQANYSVKTNKIQTSKKDLLIDPYFLGLWLGDGTSRNSGITTIEPEIIQYLRDYAEKLGLCLTEVGQKIKTYVISTKNNQKLISLTSRLKKLNLIKNKHIPQKYFVASVSQRMDLLAGLIDSDGYVQKDGGVEFCSINKNLAQDVVKLLSGLGIKAKMAEGNASIKGKFISKKYRVTFTTQVIISKLKRKSSITKKSRKDLDRVYIWNVKRINSVPVQCLTVDDDSHLFLAGYTLIPTHNSVAAVNELIKRALSTSDTRNWYITNDYKQAKRNVWDLFLNYVPKEAQAKFNKQELSIRFPNGSLIELIGVENLESLRGAKVHFAVLDEYADFPSRAYAEVIRPMFATTGGTVWFIGTPKGLGNDLYYKYVTLDKSVKKFKFPACQVNSDGKVIDILSEYAVREELQSAYDNDDSPDKSVFKQEYLGDFTRPFGTVYSQWDLSNYTDVPYDSNLPLHITFDFGVNDPTAVIWIQPHGSETRIIDYYEASNADINHFVQVINSKPYKTPDLFTGDVAGRARELGTGLSVIDVLKKSDIHVKTKTIPNIPFQIRVTHTKIKDLYIDQTRATRFRDCILNYRYPEESDRARDRSNEIPIHDEFSHGMRAFEYWCVNTAKEPKTNIRKRPTEYQEILKWVDHKSRIRRGEYI